MTIQGNTDIEKAISLLREIEAYLCFNPQPSAAETQEIKKTINEFTENFPSCWECDDSGFVDPSCSLVCLNCNHI